MQIQSCINPNELPTCRMCPVSGGLRVSVWVK
uniref:Uncharacterized protein n=1 Tax=Anguilla anguilla TaxID=7936 RepID=A0A0E9PPI5_ANGAN